LLTYSTFAFLYELGHALLVLLAKNHFLKDLVIIFLAAKAMGHLSVLFGQPSIFGQLLVGIILGPAVLNILHPNLLLNQLAQLGVLMLMFLAGLETNLREFTKNTISSFFTASGGVILPFISGALLALMCGYTLNIALFIGVVLVSTSVSISVQTLRELNRMQSKEGITILGAAVIDDILGLIILSMVLALATGGEEFTIISIIIIKIIAFFILAIFAGYFLVPFIMFLASKVLVREGRLTFALIIVLTLSMAAEYLGLAGIVGAYFAGIMVGRMGFRGELISKVEAIGYSFFFPVFFVSIGLVADITSLKGSLLIFTIIMTLIAVFTKIFGAGLGALCCGFSTRSSLAIGAGMVSRGEVALIIANIGLASGLLTTDLYTVMVVVTIITTIITPVLIKLTFK
jgi:Kef-type K+ transport system membrane component KefB